MKAAVLTSALLVVTVYCQASCGDAVSTDATPSSCPSTWMLFAQPEDLSTDTGAGEVSVVVQYAHGTRRPSQAVLDVVAAAITVKNASDEEVAAQIVPVFGTPSREPAHEPDSIDGRLEHQDRILVVPASPWANEWYSVTVGELSCKYQFAGFKTSVDGSSGVLRFNPQSLPIYQSLEFCDYGEDKGTRLVIALSQPLRDRGQISVNLKVTADGLDCSFTHDADNGEGSDRVFEAWCDAGDVSSLLFAVNEPLVATDGQPFTTLGGSQVFSVAWPSSAWRAEGTGCWTWSPQ